MRYPRVQELVSLFNESELVVVGYKPCLRLYYEIAGPTLGELNPSLDDARAESGAAGERGDDEPAEARTRSLSHFGIGGGEDSGASGEPAVGVVSEDVESIRCRIGLIDFRERALLLRHEDVNPEFEQVIGFAGGHLVETLELEACHAVQCSPYFAYGVGVITVTSVVEVQSHN